MGGGEHGGHTVVTHRGQQQGQGPHPCTAEGARGGCQTDTHTLRPLYDDTGGVANVKLYLLSSVTVAMILSRSDGVLVFRSVLVAACEENDLLMFDPHNEKLIGSRDAAHNDSVNCVRCVNPALLYSCTSPISGACVNQATDRELH